MNLYLLRHGEAEEQSSSGMDCDRALTEVGKQKLFDFAVGLKHSEISFDCIISSPYIRAVETAEIYAEVFKYEKKIEHTEHFTPAANFVALINLLKKHKGKNNILLVGHEPSISSFASFLISGKELSGIKFSKSGICCIEFFDSPEKSKGEIKWLLTPKLMKIFKK